MLLQGVDFIHSLISESSYDDKKALLKSAFLVPYGQANLYNALISRPESDLNNIVTVSDYADEDDLEALFPPIESHDQNTDKGPFEAWRVAFNRFSTCMWVMLTDNSELREWAYVFWDLDRMETSGMLELFEYAPGYSELELACYDDIDEMRESFEERSKIWRKGGSGYWSKNDES